MKIRSIFPGRDQGLPEQLALGVLPAVKQKVTLALPVCYAGDDLRRAAWPLSMLDVPP